MPVDESLSVLILIPAYNEETSLSYLLPEIQNELQFKSKYRWEIVVVSDGSTDKTEKVCKANGVTCIRLDGNFGVGTALRTGYEYASMHGAQILVQVDADGQHPIQYIKKAVDLISEITKSYEDVVYVIGNRHTHFSLDEQMQFGKTKEIGQKILSLALKKASGIYVNDPTNGFRALTAGTVQILRTKMPSSYLDDSVLTIRTVSKAKGKLVEFPMPVVSRKHGDPTHRGIGFSVPMIRVVLDLLLRSE